MTKPIQYWIMKSEPDEYSFDDLVREGKTLWDGVRNYQARNNMKAMAVDDRVLIYHSISEKALVGIAKVSQTAFPDPTITGENPKGWVVVELVPVQPLQKSINLQTLKTHATLCEIALVKQSRLSVIPLDKADYETILALSETKAMQ
ncbi:MAG: EVE domain-containing protein [Cyanobacteria bacterium P01_H01_bin.74]